MGGSDQPFLYPPCTPLSQRRVAYPYSNFNPKAVTQASYQALHEQSHARPQAPKGPLIRFDSHPMNPSVSSSDNAQYTSAAFAQVESKRRAREVVNFNQHPDSWTIVAGHSVKYEPMPDNTKSMVEALRWLQFTLRVHEGLLAVGLLVFMVCFKKMPNTFSWIMRIAPAWDTIVSLYACYHLFRPANARTPASSASYHIFAVCMDIALLPFYIYMSLYAHAEYVKPAGSASRWGSLFSNADTTTSLLLATFVGAAVISGLHLLSAALDAWLIVIFNKIARLPPDANPLEDNLTSRAAPTRTSKHKYKNSELTLTGDDVWSEKKPGYLSGSTLEVDRHSRISNTSRDVDEADSHKIPFNHSRAKSSTTFSPHNPETARLSHQHFEDVALYEEDGHSRAGMESPSRQINRDDDDEALPWPPQVLDRSSRPGSSKAMLNEADITDFAARSRGHSPAIPNAASPQTRVQSQQKETLLTGNNWYTFDGNDDDASTLASSDRPAYSNYKYDGIVLERPHEEVEEEEEEEENLAPEPLKMHPPTPPPKDGYSSSEDDEYPDPEEDTFTYAPISVKRKPLTVRNDVGNASYSHLGVQRHDTTASSAYSDDNDPSAWKENATAVDDVRGGTPKRKYYGDLAAATRGVLGTVKYKATAVGAAGGNANGSKNRILSAETVKSNGTVDAAAMDATGMSALSGYGYGRVTSGTYGKRKKEGGGKRVVSRSSGVDIVDLAGRGEQEREGLGGFGGLRGRREVSGKIAEEGRAGGGAWWSRRIY